MEGWVSPRLGIRYYGQPPLQQVLYVGEAPLTMPARLEYPTLTFQYEPIDIRTLDGAALLTSPSLEDNLLALFVPSAGPSCSRPGPAGTYCEPGGDSTRRCPGQTRDPGRAQAPPPSCTRGDPTDAHHH